MITISALTKKSKEKNTNQEQTKHGPLQNQRQDQKP